MACSVGYHRQQQAHAFPAALQYVPGSAGHILSVGWQGSKHDLWDFEKGGTVADPFGDDYATIAPNRETCARIQYQSVDLYEAKNPQKVVRRLDVAGVQSVAWSNKSDRIATYGQQGLWIWDPNLAMPLMKWPGDPRPISQMGVAVWQPDDKSVLAWMTGQPHVYLLDVTQSEAKVITTTVLPEGVFTVARQPQGDAIAVQCGSGVVRIYDLKTNALVHAFGESASALAWSADGELLALGVGDAVQVWDCKTLADPVRLYTLDKPVQRSVGLLFAPHGDTLISCSNDGKLRLWELQTGQLRGTVVFLNDGWLAVTAEGHYLASPGAEDDGSFAFQFIEDRPGDDPKKAVLLSPKDFANTYKNWVNDPEAPRKALR